MENVNYMNEIRNIENALYQIDESINSKENISMRGRLSTMLYNLEATADEMASYISGEWDAYTITQLKQNSISYLKDNNYREYLSSLTKMMRLERAMLICSNQQPDEKRYFIEEYYKYKQEKENQGKAKVR